MIKASTIFIKTPPSKFLLHPLTHTTNLKFSQIFQNTLSLSPLFISLILKILPKIETVALTPDRRQSNTHCSDWT